MFFEVFPVARKIVIPKVFYPHNGLRGRIWLFP